MKYQIIISNIGTVHQGNNKKAYLKTFKEFKKIVLAPYGIASGECLTCLVNGEIEFQILPKEIKMKKLFLIVLEKENVKREILYKSKSIKGATQRTKNLVKKYENINRWGCYLLEYVKPNIYHNETLGNFIVDFPNFKRAK